MRSSQRGCGTLQRGIRSAEHRWINTVSEDKDRGNWVYCVLIFAYRSEHQPGDIFRNYMCPACFYTSLGKTCSGSLHRSLFSWHVCHGPPSGHAPVCLRWPSNPAPKISRHLEQHPWVLPPDSGFARIHGHVHAILFLPERPPDGPSGPPSKTTARAAFLR